MRFRMSARPPPLGFVELVHGAQVALAGDHRFERPDRPEWDQRREGFVLAHQALAGLPLERQVIAQQARSVAGSPGRLLALLGSHLGGNAAARPRSGNADADCWRPSSRRGSRKSVRGRCRAADPGRRIVRPIRSTTRARSGTLMRATVRSCRGEKQPTRQMPGSPPAISRPPRSQVSGGVPGSSAAKSLSNTNVLV